MADGTFDAAARAAFLDHLRGGMMLGAAAYVLQLPRHVVEGYIAEHADYALEVADAKATATEHVQEAVYQAAVSGNIQAAKLWFTLSGRVPRSGGGSAPPPSPDAGDADLGAAMAELE